jgi:hypothetical protein
MATNQLDGLYKVSDEWRQLFEDYMNHEKNRIFNKKTQS